MLKPVVMLVTLFVFSVGSAIAAPANCPVINGFYAMDAEDAEGPIRYRVLLFTKTTGGRVSYALRKDNTYSPVDGRERDITVDGVDYKAAFRCESRSLITELREPDLKAKVIHRYTFESKTGLRVETNIEGVSGLYVAEPNPPSDLRKLLPW